MICGNEKKEKENKKIKDDNERLTKMEDGMEAEHEEKTQLKEIKIEKLETIEAEAEPHTTMVTKDECNKEIEREKNKNSVKILTINYNQVLIEVKKKQAEIFALKGKRIFKLDKWLEDDIVAETKDRNR